MSNFRYRSVDINVILIHLIYFLRNFLEKLENNGDSTDESQLDEELRQVQ